VPVSVSRREGGDADQAAGEIDEGAAPLVAGLSARSFMDEGPVKFPAGPSGASLRCG